MLLYEQQRYIKRRKDEIKKDVTTTIQILIATLVAFGIRSRNSLGRKKEKSHLKGLYS